MALVTVTNTCPLCSKPSQITVDKDRYDRFRHGQQTGESAAISGAQVLFPDLSPGDREMLISGCHESCFDKAFAEDD